MRFVDEATIKVQAGHGGRGAVSFRREKFVPFGGPDGGDGGKGADIYLVGTPGINTLADFRFNRAFRGPERNGRREPGLHGRGRSGSGRRGADWHRRRRCRYRRTAGRCDRSGPAPSGRQRRQGRLGQHPVQEQHQSHPAQGDAWSAGREARSAARTQGDGGRRAARDCRMPANRP